MFVDGRFSAPSVIFKSYLGEGTIYNFINSLVEESTYCTDVMKKHFNEKLVMTKRDLNILRTLLNVGFVTMVMLMMKLN